MGPLIKFDKVLFYSGLHFRLVDILFAELSLVGGYVKELSPNVHFSPNCRVLSCLLCCEYSTALVRVFCSLFIL